MRASARGRAEVLVVLLAVARPAEARSQAASPEQTQAREREAKNPARFGAAFYSGAQAEFVGPTPGVSAGVAGYDAVFMQIDASIGLGVGGSPLGSDRNDIYTFGLRLAFPVHRGVQADYSLLVAGGATLLDRSEDGLSTIGSAGGGARFRVFMTPNVAVAATLGLILLFSEGDTFLFLGARPLGSAAVVYYFR